MGTQIHKLEIIDEDYLDRKQFKEQIIKIKVVMRVEQECSKENIQKKERHYNLRE